MKKDRYFKIIKNLVNYYYNMIFQILSKSRIFGGLEIISKRNYCNL